MGTRGLPTALLLAAVLLMQALAVAHAFDHPVATPHADHVCASCAHGHLGSGPPSQSQAALLPAGTQSAARSLDTRDWFAPHRSVYSSRGPPRSLA